MEAAAAAERLQPRRRSLQKLEPSPRPFPDAPWHVFSQCRRGGKRDTAARCGQLISPARREEGRLAAILTTIDSAATATPSHLDKHNVATTTPSGIASCHCCGLVQRLPASVVERRLVCARCRTPLVPPHRSRNGLSAALASAALILYLPATTLPMVRIEQLGHRHEDSLLSAVIALFAQGDWLIGAVVLLFSIVLPPLKLFALLLLAAPGLIPKAPLRAVIYRGVEALGRWGMLDVMLVAILVAVVKLGDLLFIEGGPGLIAYTVLVLLSLLASMSFNPHAMWGHRGFSAH